MSSDAARDATERHSDSRSVHAPKRMLPAPFQQECRMQLPSLSRPLRAAAVAAVLLGLGSAAQAADVYFSVGVPVYSEGPAYVQAPPVYAQPDTVYAQPAIVAPDPVYAAPAPVYASPYWADGDARRAYWEHRRWEHERWEHRRWERRHRGWDGDDD
jgi:hypothetical protein